MTRYEDRIRTKDGSTQVFCLRCRRWYDSSFFAIDLEHKGRFYSRCRKCRRDDNRETYNRRRNDSGVSDHEERKREKEAKRRRKLEVRILGKCCKCGKPIGTLPYRNLGTTESCYGLETQHVHIVCPKNLVKESLFRPKTATDVERILSR